MQTCSRDFEESSDNNLSVAQIGDCACDMRNHKLENHTVFQFVVPHITCTVPSLGYRQVFFFICVPANISLSLLLL